MHGNLCLEVLVLKQPPLVSGGRPRGEADVVPQHREGDLSGRRRVGHGVHAGVGKCHARSEKQRQGVRRKANKRAVTSSIDKNALCIIAVAPPSVFVCNGKLLNPNHCAWWTISVSVVENCYEQGTGKAFYLNHNSKVVSNC